MSTTLTTKTTTKARKTAIRSAARGPAARQSAGKNGGQMIRLVNGDMVPRHAIIDIDGPGIDFEGGEDEKGDFKPLPVEQHLMRPPHPGAILTDLFLPPTGLTQGGLADRLGVSRRTLSLVINGSRAVTVDIAMRLARAFGTGVGFWLGLQRQCDLWDAAHADPAEYDHIQPIERRVA